jgi:large subunit ribosomal protein L33
MHPLSDAPAPPARAPAPGKNEPMAKSDKRPIIKLKSTAGTGYTYVTRKNKTNTRERIELKKYDPRIRQHVIFKEER